MILDRRCYAALYACVTDYRQIVGLPSLGMTPGVLQACVSTVFALPDLPVGHVWVAWVLPCFSVTQV